MIFKKEEYVIICLKYAKLAKCEDNDSLKINTNVGHVSMNANYGHCTPDIQEYNLNAPSSISMSLNDNQQIANRMQQHLKKTDDTSTSTIFSATV